MKVFNRIVLRAFCRATEEEEKVAEALLFAAGLAEPPAIGITELEGYGGAPFVSMELEIGRQQDIRSFWNSLPAEVISGVLETLEGRLDEENILHFRLDKQKAYLGRFSLASGGDVIAVEARVLSYPSSREAALKNAGDFLGQILKIRS